MGVTYNTYQIYTNALLVADVPNTNFWTQNDAILSLQSTMRKIWGIYAGADDDYFLTAFYFTNATFIADSTRPYMYYIALPTDLYRLRLLQYAGMNAGNLYQAAQKMTIEGYGNTQNSPAYRMIGQLPAAPQYISTQTYTSGQYVYYQTIIYQANTSVPVSTPPPAAQWTTVTANPTGYIALYDPSGFQNWAMSYYPQPPTITLNISTFTGYDIGAIFPDNLVPEIFVQEMAIAIRRKQKVDYTQYQQERDELYKTLMNTIRKDDNKPEPIKDVFAWRFSPYV